ncbi:nuclease-related domain-containing protein [Falsibacillus pallidus]|uniref:Nuclease-like protein n=1 Tax=Falsibacillus pallidus TaxID=493781 RepID=A0A370GE45_9BACI|nr:nuclease-related domain-containing protein [Falsibacillus pallidus]RDI41379.1 nuclease-like protein [Falsibacillus pallidus]
MIVKQLTVPIQIRKLEALLNRFPIHDERRERIFSDYQKAYSGYIGEKAMQYPLSYLDPERYLIFHDIRLKAGEHFFQIDILILSTKFILISEVKNITGRLFLDHEHKQLIRTIDDKEESFTYPIDQLTLQQIQLKKWLHQHSFPLLPIEGLVVFTNESSILTSSKPHEKIIKKSSFIHKMLDLEKRFNQVPDYSENINTLSDTILQNHTPQNKSLLQKYQISKDELITGIQCPNCQQFAMKRSYKYFNCSQCRSSSKSAYLKALEEYVLLFDSLLTNKQGREFLEIKSPDLMQRILREISAERFGVNKSTSYRICLEALGKLKKESLE